MAQDATKVFSGPFATMEIQEGASAYEEPSLLGDEVDISFEGAGPQTSNKQTIQTKGLLVISAKVLQVGNTARARFEALQKTPINFKFTTAEGLIIETSSHIYFTHAFAFKNSDDGFFGTISAQIEVYQWSDIITLTEPA